MKRSVLSLLITSAVLFALGQASPALGAGRKKTTPPPAPRQPVIVNVSASSVTVDDEKGTRTFKVSHFTEINVNGQKATAADLKPGMRVSVTIGTDPSTASRITAAGAPKN